jgi:hypothetical protein
LPHVEHRVGVHRHSRGGLGNVSQRGQRGQRENDGEGGSVSRQLS